jgi:hypothetical protein
MENPRVENLLTRSLNKFIINKLAFLLAKCDIENANSKIMLCLFISLQNTWTPFGKAKHDMTKTNTENFEKILNLQNMWTLFGKVLVWHDKKK